MNWKTKLNDIQFQHSWSTDFWTFIGFGNGHKQVAHVGPSLKLPEAFWGPVVSL